MAASGGDDREGEALRRSEERYRTLYESARDAIVIVRDGLIVDCNRQALALFGFPSLRETVGRQVVDPRTGASPFSSPLNPPPTDRLAAAMRGEPQRFEWRIVREDRAELDLDVSLSRLPLADGEALLVVARDITAMADEKRLQETLLVLNTMHAASLRQVLDYALESALTLAQSPIGYIFFYDEPRERFTVYAWSGSAMRQCVISERQLEYELRGTGLWGEAVRQRRAVITNDYAAPSALKKGLPEGHVPITRHLNVPVLDGGRIVLVAGVGNKAAPYTEADARNLTFLMAEAWKIASHQQIEAALRESEERSRAVLQDSSDGISITDEEGRLVIWNGAMERITGIAAVEVLGRPIWQVQLRLIPEAERTPRLPERLETGIRGLLQTGASPWSDRLLEREYLRPDGSRRIIQGRTSAVRTARGHILIGTAVDITEGRRAQEEVLEWRRRYEHIFAASGQIVYDCYPAEGRIFWSASVEAVLGWRPEEMGSTQREWERHLAPEDLQTVGRMLETAERDRRPFKVEYRHRHRDGHFVHLLEQGFPLPAADGKPERIIGVMQDITERKRAEAALRESEEHFRSFIRFAPVPIVITDERGRFEHVNDRFTATFGYTLEDLPDLETWWRRAYPDEEYREEVLGVWREAMEAGRWTASRSNPLEYRVTCRDGSTRVAEVSSNHIGDRYLYLFNDLTGRKRAEEAMGRLQEQYLQAQKMEAIGRLAGGVAHDFNNLLTAILGYAEMIGTEQALPPLAREGIEEIEKSARRAAALTQQLLAFGRKQLLQPRVVDLNGLLADLEKMLRRLIGEDILLTTPLEATGALVLADPGQVEQVIINLAVNARDAMPRGGTLTIGTRNAGIGDEQEGDLAEAQPGEYVVLSVQDTGQGMDEKVRAHLFEPFFTTKEVGKGTGLGLSTVYGIVKQSGGHILVHTEPGRGTRFDLYLPQASPLPADKGEKPPAAAPRMGLETILLVEDEEALLEMTARMLVRYGYSVVKTRGPAEALERLQTAGAPRVDLLLTDVIMPGMSGRELADQAERLRPGLRVLFISGYTDDTILHHGVLDEGVAFLQKPFAPASLAGKVREVLDRQG